MTASTQGVLADVAAERARQENLWGDQSHFPDGTGPALPRSFRGAAHYSRELCQLATRTGQVTWRHVLMEEVGEVLEAPAPTELRGELVQLAAVCAQWIEAIDRRTP